VCDVHDVHIEQVFDGHLRNVCLQHIPHGPNVLHPMDAHAAQIRLLDEVIKWGQEQAIAEKVS
jgi:hypothetical protein